MVLRFEKSQFVYFLYTDDILKQIKAFVKRKKSKRHLFNFVLIETWVTALLRSDFYGVMYFGIDSKYAFFHENLIQIQIFKSPYQWFYEILVVFKISEAKISIFQTWRDYFLTLEEAQCHFLKEFSKCDISRNSPLIKILFERITQLNLYTFHKKHFLYSP